MNYQLKKVDFDEYTEKACEILNKRQDNHECTEGEFTFCLWPQVFGSTAGPCGGIGGQAMSTFTVIACAHPEGVVMFCSRKSKVVPYKDFHMGMRF